MNETQFKSDLDKLATRFGISARPTGQIVQVPVNWDAVLLFCRRQYQFLVGAYDDELHVSHLVTEDQFVTLMSWVIRKRVQFARQRTYGYREGATIRIERDFRLPLPIYQLLHVFGKVDSELGCTFVPEMPKFETGELNVEFLAGYLQFVTRLKHYYSFSEGLPSEPEGTWTYLINAQVPGETPVLQAITQEAAPVDIVLATAIQCARALTAFPYYTTFTQVMSQTQLLAMIFSSCAKGVGE